MRKWAKQGKNWFYFGEHFVIVGNPKQGYVVLERAALKVVKPSFFTFDTDGYYCSFPTRKASLELFNELEDITGSGGFLTLSLKDEAFKEYGGNVRFHGDTGAVIIAYPEDEPEALLHEWEHHQKGHVHQGGYKWSHELEAVEAEIKGMKHLKRYTPEVRDRIIDSLATYSKTKRGSLESRIKRATEAVEEIESRVEGQAARLPKWVREAVKEEVVG